MKHEELKEIFEHEKTFVPVEITLEGKPTLEFNYTNEIDFAVLYNLAKMISDAMIVDVDEEGKLIDKTTIDYGMNDALIDYGILSTFTDLDIQGDIVLAYTLNMHYDIIGYLATEDDTFAKKVEYLHKVVWKQLEFEKDNQITKITRKAFNDIQSYLAMLGINLLEENNVNVEEFVQKVVELSQLENTKDK